jgi:hypothetical protein
MSDANIEVSLSIDADAFLSRECPYCKIRFKISKEDFEGDRLAAEMFCPYCGQSASRNEFWTTEQAKYFQDVAMYKIVAPELDALESSLKKLDTNSGLFEIKITMDREDDKVPIAPEELDDMKQSKQSCCDIVIKIDETWAKGLYCIICGKKDV